MNTLVSQKPYKKKCTLTLDRELVLQLKALAQQDDRTLSSYINHVLKMHIEDYF